MIDNQHVSWNEKKFLRSTFRSGQSPRIPLKSKTFRKKFRGCVSKAHTNILFTGHARTSPGSCSYRHIIQVQHKLITNKLSGIVTLTCINFKEQI